MASSNLDAAVPRRRPADRRAQIATVGAELFCQHGYHRVRLSEIANAVGITGPAIYRHFANKHAILAHAGRELTAAVEGCAGEIRSPSSDAREDLDATIALAVQLVMERRGSVRMYQWEGRNLPEPDRARLRCAIHGLVRGVSDLLRDARPELRPRRARLLAAAALSAIASYSTHGSGLGTRAAGRGLRRLATALLEADPPAPRDRKPALATARPDGPSGDLLPAGRREQLLAAAVGLFHRRGFHGTGIAEIGAAAGINASSVYRHFAGKADLLAAVYYCAADRLAATTGAVTGQATDPSDALCRLIDAYTGFAIEHRELAAVYLAEYTNLPTADRHELRRVQRDHIALWVRLAGRVREDPKPAQTQLAVHATLNVIHDVSMTGGRLADWAQIRHLARTLLFRAVD